MMAALKEKPQREVVRDLWSVLYGLGSPTGTYVTRASLDGREEKQ